MGLNPELGLFNQVKSFDDYRRLEDEFQMRKQQQELAGELGRAKIGQIAQGRDLPAAIQVANEIKKRIDAGDIEGANLIYQSAKIGDKGIGLYGGFETPQATPTFSPAGMQGDDAMLDSLGQAPQMQNQMPATPQFYPQAVPGYGEAVGSIEAAKKGMSTQAQKEVELRMNPSIEAATREAGAVGAERGVQRATFESASARMPQLVDMANKLSQLGKAATYTMAGQARDTFLREMGMPVPESAVARTEYISMVDNQILPLLRETFGAQFTQKEGESLKATLGDPNKSPEEKDAVLRSFIATKMGSLNTQARQLGESELYAQEDIDQAVGSISGQKPQITPEEAFKELKRRREGK
jgi:hypothetical protein